MLSIINMKKEAKAFLFFVPIFVFSIAISSLVVADEVGCCTNPGAGLLVCSTERLIQRDRECCPNQQDFPYYYKSQQNPDNPLDYSECSANFFFPNKECPSVDACALGCCCSELGGSITSDAQCKGTGLKFYKGATECSSICPVPQCNDNIDNDNNGCADFENGDLGCTSPADATESGGSCIKQGAGCIDPNYVPKLSNFEITPAKGQKRFLLQWKDECSDNAVSYDILRCRESGCTNFVVVGTAAASSFEDASDDLLFNTVYTYQVKARYSLQTSAPSITKTASSGDIECFGQAFSNNFCIHESYYSQYKDYLSANFPDFSKDFASAVKNKFGSKLNKAFSCTSANNLIPEGTSCSSSQVCIVTDNKPSCINKANCNYNEANPFGLFYTQEGCEKGNEKYKYCFYDKSRSTINSCFSCNPSMVCYDYKSEGACTRDNCRVGNCKWKKLAEQIGIGGCVSATGYNCQWCDKKGTPSLENIGSFNEVFDLCTKEKSDALSEGSFKCHFLNGKSKGCNDVVCKDYGAEQCSNAQITHDESNKIKNPSTDECGIKVCQNIDNSCVKNADGDNKADCASTSSTCENDYFAPDASLTPVIKKGLVESLLIQIYDKTSANSQPILKTSGDYATFLCAEPCGTQGHPYTASTASRKIIISNLNAFDSVTGNKLLTLSEGTNTIRHYSQDPSKNIGEVKKIAVEAHGNSSGPKVLSIEVTGGSAVLDKIFTANQKPTIVIQFFEPAVITHSRIVNKKTGSITTLQASPEPDTKFSFLIAEALSSGEYIFELNAKSKNGIFMEAPVAQAIVIDNNKPVIKFVPSNGAVINTSIVAISLTFDKEVILDDVKINSEDISDKFSTADNKVFTAEISMNDGNKKLVAAAKDYSGNQVNDSVLFIVDAKPTVITLASPKFGTAPKSIFKLAVETDNDAACRFSLDDNLEFEFMDEFAVTGGVMHSTQNFGKIASGDTKVHKLYVRCIAKRGVAFSSFDINVDTTPPILKSAFAHPNPIVEKPIATTLTIESDEPVVCKFSSTSREFGSMEGKFEGFDDNAFRSINKQIISAENENTLNESSFLYFAACENKAGLISETKEVPFKVDLSIPISIISHTPEFFNSTNVVLAIETNKKSQCKFSESDSTAQSGEIFGMPGYSHTRQLALPQGNHTFFIICKDQYLQRFSDVKSVTFTIDTTPPAILSVDDSSAIENNPEFTFSTDSLRVKWHSIDYESRVKSHTYSIVEAGTSKVVLDSIQSSLNNEYIIAAKPNGTNLGLVNGNRYFFRVRAQNVVGLFSNISESDGITVDTSLKPLNCTNGVQDEKETDVDCGSGCDLCDLGKRCKANIDCRSSFCNNGLCSAPKCDDNIKNGEESDVDCGSSCMKCQNNKACISNNDCESGFCSFGSCKPQESCSDSRLSPGEADLDCGGHCPAKCTEGKSCSQKEDCAESLQCVSSLCRLCNENDINCNGIPDEQEETNASKDTDGDGMPDEWEIQNALNLNDPSDAQLDADNDGLTNLEEFEAYKTYGKSTNPNLEDTDGDSFSDKREIDNGTSPVDPEDFPKSSLMKIIAFVFGIVALVSGFGYLAYRAKQRREQELGKEIRKEGLFEAPMQIETGKKALQYQGSQAQQAKQLSLKRKEEEARIREMLKEKESQKAKERERLFEAFGREEKVTKEEAKIEPKKAKIEMPKQELKETKKAKPHKERVKEGIFTRLAGIAKEKKQRKSKPDALPKQKKDRLERLYELAESKKKAKKHQK